MDFQAQAKPAGACKRLFLVTKEQIKAHTLESNGASLDLLSCKQSGTCLSDCTSYCVG